jgi:hypothetical protein
MLKKQTATGEGNHCQHSPQFKGLACTQTLIDDTTTKWCLMSVHSGTLTSRSVHPASPVLLTKNGPLVLVHSNVHVQLRNKDFLHI